MLKIYSKTISQRANLPHVLASNIMRESPWLKVEPMGDGQGVEVVVTEKAEALVAVAPRPRLMLAGEKAMQ